MTSGWPHNPWDAGCTDELAVLAAQALAHGLTMVTRNTREFERVKGLKVEDWL